MLLEIDNLSRLNHEEIENLNRLITAAAAAATTTKMLQLCLTL